MGRFAVIDDYDYYVPHKIIIETDDLLTAYNACLKYIADTNGECDVDIYDRESSPDTPIIAIYGYKEE